jgi:hypothetical protein
VKAKTKTRAKLSEADRGKLARKTFAHVPIPRRATVLPRAGSLRSVALFVLWSTRRALTAEEIGQRARKLTWAPPLGSARRLLTVLGELRTGKLITNGPDVERKGDSGPLNRKTWIWKP